jgi:hypothetical protein
MEDKVYEHEVVTTVRFTVRSLEPYMDKQKFLEEFAYLTDMSQFTEGDDYPRVVATSVIEDQLEYMDKEINDE